MQPNQNRVAIAMSKFGRDRLVSAGVPDVQYAPHTVNTKLFTPVGPNYRKQFTIPEDAHVTICNAANKGVPSRKGYPELLAAWVMFANKHDDAWLYLHTEEHGLAGGLQLGRLLKALKAPMDRVRIAPQYQYRAGIPTSEMPGIYRMGDVICMPSYGEGFGIPAVEAGAVGVAQIVSDWTAQPELLGAGWKVGGQPWWNEPMASWWLIPNIEEIGAALEESYKVKGDKAASAALSEQARQFALQYDTDTVYESHWKPILSYLESRLSPPKNRAQRRAK
jgi:glycosyltransferase involved in cell wall biosynthesis